MRGQRQRLRPARAAAAELRGQNRLSKCSAQVRRAARVIVLRTRLFQADGRLRLAQEA